MIVSDQQVGKPSYPAGMAINLPAAQSSFCRSTRERFQGYVKNRTANVLSSK